MPETIAQQVLAALVERLTVIRRAAGFNTDAGEHVFQGRIYIDEESELPALSIIENLEQATTVQVDGPQVRETTPYEVQGLIACRPNAPLIEGHQLLADIKRALFLSPAGPEFEQLIPGATIDYRGRQIFQRLESAKHCEVHVLLEVVHTERYGDPYTA